MNQNHTWLLLSISVMLAACAKPYAGLPDNQTPMSNGAEVGTYYNSDAYVEASTGDYYDDPNYGMNVQAGPNAPARDKILYFAFDSSRLDARSEAIVRAHADYMARNPQVIVTLEGHTDERGTNEYNLRLSERRGYAVRDRMQSYGISGGRLNVVGHGEEQPAAWGQDEASYAKNRRVVIDYH